MGRLKGGKFLIDLTPLGDISQLNVGDNTSLKEFDISNLLPVKDSRELTRLLCKKFIFKVESDGDECLIESSSTTSMGYSDTFTFNFELDGIKGYIAINFADSFNSNINPSILIHRTE